MLFSMKQRNSLLLNICLGTILLHHYSNALNCYTCTATGSGTDCELHPDQVVGPTRDCDKKYCTLRRVEYVSNGKVYSFYRSCEDNPIYMDKIITDDTYKTYFYACSTDLCNGGSGITDSGVNGNGNNVPPGVTKPPFNMNVLHFGAGFSVKASAALSAVAAVSAIIYGYLATL